MTQQFRTYDASQIPLVRKLTKHSGSGPSHGVLEIDGVHEVDGKGHSVDHYEQPFTHFVVDRRLLPMKWKEHQDYV